MKVNVTKTKYVTIKKTAEQIQQNIEATRNVDHFMLLGSAINKDGTIENDVELRVQATWSRWRKLTGVLYDKKMLFKLK